MSQPHGCSGQNCYVASGEIFVHILKLKFSLKRFWNQFVTSLYLRGNSETNEPSETNDRNDSSCRNKATDLKGEVILGPRS